MDVRTLLPRMRVLVNVGHGANPWHPGVVIECFQDEAFIVNASSKHHELLAIAIVPKNLNEKTSFEALKLSKHSYFYERNHGVYRAHQIRSDRGACPNLLFIEISEMIRPYILAWRRQRSASGSPPPATSETE